MMYAWQIHGGETSMIPTFNRTERVSKLKALGFCAIASAIAIGTLGCSVRIGVSQDAVRACNRLYLFYSFIQQDTDGVSFEDAAEERQTILREFVDHAVRSRDEELTQASRRLAAAEEEATSLIEAEGPPVPLSFLNRAVYRDALARFDAADLRARTLCEQVGG